ncbi:MAG: alpha-amylase family glycosyl hydrolase [Reichenbachiella sp.]
MKESLLIILLLSFFTSCSDDNGLSQPGSGGPTEEIEVDPFDKIPSLTDMVVYEVNIGAMSQSGSFSGVESKLDHLESLGVNVVWLMPIYPIGVLNGVGSPYAVQDYVGIRSSFGTKNDLISLINEAHSRDMAVVLDWVANHTAWDHAWINNEGWYSTDTNGDIIEPPGTGWTDVAELNFDNQDMRTEMITSMNYWISTLGIDGFRCDAVDFVPDDFWEQAITAVNSTTNKDLIWLAEGGHNTNFDVGFEFNYSWDYYNKIKDVYAENASASGLFTVHQQEMGGVPAGMTKLRYITNHDVYAWDESVTDVYKTDGSVGAFVSTVFMGGIPLIYNGQEVAEPNLISFFNNDPIDWSQNPEVFRQYQQIMGIRSDLTTLLKGELMSYIHKDALIYKRKGNNDEVLIIINTRENEIKIDLDQDLQNSNWTDLMSNDAIDLSEQLAMSGYEYKILKKR